MGLFSNQFANVVEWEEYRDDLLFWKWTNREIKKDSRLIIKPGQDAIFLYNGAVEGIFTESGSYTIDSDIIPFLCGKTAKFTARNASIQYLPFQVTGKENRDVDTMLQAFCATDQQLDLYIAPTNGSVNYQQIIESFCLPDSVRVHYTDGVIPYLLAQKVARKSCVVICCMDFPYTIGLTTLVEAFALGIPVICSRNPNFEMDIDKEEIGITVAYDDVEEIGRASCRERV